MRVDIHDHEFAVLALARLALGMGQEFRGVEFLNGQAMDVVRGRDFHWVFSRCVRAHRALTVLCRPWDSCRRRVGAKAKDRLSMLERAPDRKRNTQRFSLCYPWAKAGNKQGAPPAPTRCMPPHARQMRTLRNTR